MYKWLIIFILMLGGLTTTHAQLIQVSGYIITHDSSGVVPFANIHNKKTKTGTQATIEGFYTILVAHGDSVEITAIGYEKAILFMPKSFTGTSFHYDVTLKHLTYSLPTFTKYYMDMEIFKREFTAMTVPEDKKYITIDNGQITNRTPVPANFGITLNGPISWLYNKFSRKAKEMAKLADLKSNQFDEYTAIKRLTPEFITIATGLPAEKTKDLADYCDISESALATYSNYDLILALLRCLDSYKKDKNLTDEDLGIKPQPLNQDSVKTDTQNK